jgi:hypothetical protein
MSALPRLKALSLSKGAPKANALGEMGASLYEKTCQPIFSMKDAPHIF